MRKNRGDIDMKSTGYTLCVILLCTIGCAPREAGERQELVAVAGCWKGVHVSPIGRFECQWNYFSLRPDSSLALSLVYEIGPRSRVWSLNEDVSVHEGKVLWENHEGVVNQTRDTMTIVQEYHGEKLLWQFVRNRSCDSLMAELYDCAGESYVYHQPENLNDGWTSAGLMESRINAAKIVALVEEIRGGQRGDVHSMLVVKGGKLVVEEYFAANGSKHGALITSLFRKRVHHLASTTKSVTSALVGMTIDQGFIQSVDEPIYHYLPAYASVFSEDKKQIRIRDMLTMTAGLEWRQFGVSEAQNDGMQMWHTDDVIRFVLEKPLVTEPGKEFNYTNGVPTVTGAIIKNAVGMEVKEFVERNLFGPLGISEFLWTSYPDGSIETDGGLALRARDLAKIGQLFLNGGVWNGKRIVSEQWVRESTIERLRFGKSNRWGYGYHWMQTEMRIGDTVVHSYFVPGDGNQILAVFPEFEMVVVFTAGNYGRDPKPEYHSLLTEFILPSVKFNE
jgi:CubicO group peptidase (beta-lactamase class C family)